MDEIHGRESGFARGKNSYVRKTKKNVIIDFKKEMTKEKK